MFAGGGQPSWAMTLSCVADITAYCDNDALMSAEFDMLMNMSLKLIMQARLCRTDFDSRVSPKTRPCMVEKHNTWQHNKLTRAQGHKA